MGQPVFNTHDAVTTLVDSGLPENQASAIVKIVDQKMSEFVTEKYLDLKLDNLRMEIRQDLDSLRSELKGDVSSLRSELKDVRSELYLAMAQMENRLLIRLTGAMAVVASLTVGLAKVLF